MNKTVIAYCTSGLGNRLMTIIGAYYWSKKLNYDLKYIWPITNECMCPMSDLFTNVNDALLDESEIYNLTDKVFVAGFVYQKNEVAKKLDNIKHNLSSKIIESFNNLTETESLFNSNLSNYDTIIYNDIKIPSYINKRNIYNALIFLKISPTIAAQVKNFIQKHNINTHTKGILIRRTDGITIFHQRSNQYYYDLLNHNPDKKFFITSDDEVIEKSFKVISNAICYPKLEYVKSNQNDIYRGRQSVIEAFICMLILSFTDIHDNKILNSSFLKLATYYSKIKI